MERNQDPEQPTGDVYAEPITLTMTITSASLDIHVLASDMLQEVVKLLAGFSNQFGIGKDTAITLQGPIMPSNEMIANAVDLKLIDHKTGKVISSLKGNTKRKAESN